jgi:hypothetical protein
MSTIQVAMKPLINQQLLDDLKRVFPNPIVEPNCSYDEVMYKSGQSSVVRWIEAKLNAQGNKQG